MPRPPAPPSRPRQPGAWQTRPVAAHPNRRLVLQGLAAGLPVALAAPAVLAQTSDLAQRLGDLDQLHSLQVMRGDALLVAEAPRGRGLDRTTNIKSCSKSLVALMLGTALARNEVPGLDARLDALAPNLIPRDATPGVGAITLRDMVTLRAGLEGTSGGNYGAWVSSGNWISYVLRRPMIAEPGTRMIYSTGTTHLLGAVLEEATGQSLLRLMRDRLGGPLGIDIPSWTADPQGHYFGGNEMALTPRAMLRIAQMMRDGGRWQGTQVIAQDWVTASAEGLTRSPYSGLSYGLGWFISPSGYVLARGYGGQIIAANPGAGRGRGLAVAITSDPNRPARSQGHFGALMDLLDGPILAMS